MIWNKQTRVSKIPVNFKQGKQNKMKSIFQPIIAKLKKRNRHWSRKSRFKLEEVYGEENILNSN